MTTYYSVNKSLPKAKDWTTNQFTILSKLTKQSGTTLFEKISDDENIYAYPQYEVLDIDRLIQQNHHQNFFFELINYLDSINNMGLFDSCIIGHGNSHGIRVAWLSTVISTIEHFTFNQTIVLVIAGLFHDVGRTWSNLDDQFHGEKSFNRLAAVLNCSKTNFSKLTTNLNSLLFKSLTIQSPLSETDTELLKHLICIHSLDAKQKELYKQRFYLSESKEFIYLSNIFDDCDALDRLRFHGNLNINFLNTEISKSLIRYAKEIQSKF
ncbi:hypothetical protein ACWOC1_13270 [Enterococcus quebecensis]|uniref:HD domain-containing protein n=1 Tax=Enterococcus quebecensis TaxID=903983 RepID=A0A1E5GTH1_9ENTE|nr:hypothetical protein [Enterococcus quebecensis]OEG15963.1 hypothetical protein BCR23_07385 [Enterococcus quebecensis]OJG74936.1 hypothetical protein RV12_GL001981 [Enterococcus quebecensis]